MPFAIIGCSGRLDVFNHSDRDLRLYFPSQFKLAFLQMSSLDPCEIYQPAILEVAVQSAVLSIRQRGDLQYLALVNYIINALGKPQYMYHGTDMASLALIGHLPGTLGYGLTIYKRGVVKAYECVDTSSSSATLCRVCTFMPLWSRDTPYSIC